MTPYQPSDAELERGLRRLIGSEVRLRGRSRSPYSSTHVIERIAVTAGSRVLDLVCKHGSNAPDDISGQRRGPRYEAEVYERLQALADPPIPKFWGSIAFSTSDVCLVMESIEGHRVNRSPDPEHLLGACQTLGRFHRRWQETNPEGLNTFDAANLRRIVERWTEMTGELTQVGSDWPQIAAEMVAVPEILSQVRPTLIHGELYPSNVVVSESRCVFVDWESAGVGPGVIDLAMLT